MLPITARPTIRTKPSYKHARQLQEWFACRYQSRDAARKRDAVSGSLRWRQSGVLSISVRILRDRRNCKSSKPLQVTSMFSMSLALLFAYLFLQGRRPLPVVILFSCLSVRLAIVTMHARSNFVFNYVPHLDHCIQELFASHGLQTVRIAHSCSSYMLLLPNRPSLDTYHPCERTVRVRTSSHYITRRNNLMAKIGR